MSQNQVYNIQQHPQLAELDFGAITLHHTEHAKVRAAQRDMKLPTLLDVSAGTVVEMEVLGRELKKLVVRVSSKTSKTTDDVFVIIPQTSAMWLLLSCYQNDKADKHNTLNPERLTGTTRGRK